MDVFCFHCMRKLEGQVQVCPYCGKNPQATAFPHQLPPGTILNGKYLLGAAIGNGGFGITYIGLDLYLNLRVAIKEFYPNGKAQRNSSVSQYVTVTSLTKEEYQAGIDRFLKEARVLARFCGEPGIVGVRDFFPANGTAYIVMDYIDGVTLRSYVKSKGRMSGDEVFHRIQPVVNVLGKLHAEGVIHRDISPDNIMIMRDGKMCLIDFGAARKADNQDGLSVVLRPGYAPEEQYTRTGRQGPWTDIFALCGTMYFCLTGMEPTNPLERRINAQSMQWPSELGADLSPAQEQILKKGLELRAEDRWQNAPEFLHALQGAETAGAARYSTRQTPPTTENPVHRTTVPPPRQTATRPGEQRPDSDQTKEPTKNHKPLWIVLAVFLGLAALVMIGFFTIHNWESATCTKPETCTICGKTRGKPLGHNWIAATYQTPETCSRCGITQGKPLEKPPEEEKASTPTPTPKPTPIPQATDAFAGGFDNDTLVTLPNGGESHPYLLDNRITACRGMNLTFCVDEYSGNPFGRWYLYVRQADGSWTRAASFSVDTSNVNHERIYPLTFGAPYSFDAIAFGTSISDDYSLTYTVGFSDPVY